MKKIKKSKKSSVSSRGKPDVAFLIDKMQQQLVFLEKKIDTLISQSSNQPSRRHFEERRFSKPRDSFGERSLNQAICAECGRNCEVPFKPRDDRPVYCRDCFSKRQGGGSFRGKRDGGFGGERQRHDRGRKPNFRRRKERV